MAKGLEAVLVLLLCAFGFTAPAISRNIDVAFFAEVDALVLEGNIAGAETLLETEFLGDASRPLAERESLLDALAQLQAMSGKHADRGDTLTNKAALLARENGPDQPELSAVFSAAGDAYMAAGVFDRAVERYRSALRIDRIYLKCETPALGESYDRYGEALAAAGDDIGAAEARAFAADPEARCTTASSTLRGLTGSAPDGSGPDDGAAMAPEEGGFSSVELFYGTDRRPSGDLRPNAFYGSARGPIDYGRVSVAIPRDHKPGQIEAPTLFSFRWDENPALHVVVTEIERLSEEDFFRAAAARIGSAESDEVFVFIHGYNTTFAEAAKRTAQIAYDMNFEGVPMFYSWPSRGTARGYFADAASIQVSARRLLGFLEDIVARAGAGRIHLIAHSMGSRALTEALEFYAARHPEAEAVFGQIIFAAPDVDAELFALQAHAVRRLADRITLYTNATDVALTTSRALHGDAPRAGRGGDAPVVSPDFNTIDMTGLGDDMLRHSYFANQASALADILWLFWRNPGPSARCGMNETTMSEGVYWIYQTEDCDELRILPAITFARRFGSDALSHIHALIAEAEAGMATEGQSSPAELQALEVTLLGILER